MIKPEGIPTDRNLSAYVQLKSTAVQLKRGGQGYESGGTEFHHRFQGIDAPVYIAPEAADLRRSTKPIEQNSTDFGWRLRKVSETLWHFADSAWKRETELRAVQQEARTFVAEVAHTGDEWKKSADKVAENNALIDRVERALAGRLADEVQAHNEIQGLIGGPILPPDGGQGSSGAAAEMPWGTREKSPSNLDRLIWGTSFGLPHFEALPSWAQWGLSHMFRLGNPIRGAIGGLVIGGPNLIWHHIEDGLSGQAMARLQKDLDALKGLGQLATGLAMNTAFTGFGLWGPSKGLQANPYTPEWLRTWVRESDAAAAAFVGFDKFGKGDISGGAGSLIANVGGLIFTRKLPAGLGLGKALTSGLGGLGRALATTRGAGLGVALEAQAARLGRSLDAIIDGAPLRFVKEEARARADAPVIEARAFDDDALAQTHRAEREALDSAQAARQRGIEQKQEDLAAAVARSRREADIEKAFARQDADLDIAERRRIADAERPPTPDEVRARREADIKSATTRADNDQALARERAANDKDIAERKADGAVDRAVERTVERERLDIRQVGDRTAIDIQRERADAARDGRREAFDKGTEFGEDPVRSTAIALRELRKLLGQGFSLSDAADAKDPFAEGRPLDELADRLQRELGIDRDDAEDLAERAVRLRRSGVTESDVDALRGRLAGAGT